MIPDRGILWRVAGGLLTFVPGLLLADDAGSPPVGVLAAAVPAAGEVVFEPSAREDRVPERFRCEPHSYAFETEFLRTSGPVRVYKVRFPSPVTTDSEVNNTVHGEYYLPAGDGPFPG